MKFQHLYECTIFIDPTPKARPRFTRKGFCYTPKGTKDYERVVKETLRNAFNHAPVDGRPLILEIEFHMVRPKSSKRFYPTVKPDLDNFLKAIMDAANGILYRDDSLICDIIAKKRYSEEAYIRMKLNYLDCVVTGNDLAV